MPQRVGRYEIGKTLGEGTFGKVKYAVNTETGERVAVKILDKEQIQQQNMGAQIKKEISIMKLVKHPNVVQLKEVLASRTKIFIVIEFIAGGELFDKIVEAGKFDTKKSRKYFRQLISGVSFCHQQDVCHRDLKPENLLLDKDRNLKISDFGLSNFASGGEEPTSGSSETLLHTTCGTPNYVAPEVLADKGYDGKSADVWSCGVILYVLLAGFLPFDEGTMSKLFRKIQKAEYEFPPWFDDGAKDLISKILVTDAKQRLTMKEIKRHPWFNIGYEDCVPDEEDVKLDIKSHHIDNAIVSGVSSVGSPSYRAKSGAASLNAFDLINMVGGFRLNNIFNYYSGAHAQWRKYYDFMSEMPIEEIMGALTKIFTQDANVDIQATDTKKFEISAQVRHSSQVCVIHAQVYEILPNLHMVEVRRGKGDAIAYYRYLGDLSERIGINIGLATGFSSPKSKDDVKQ